MKKHFIIYCILLLSLTSCFYDPPPTGDTRLKLENESREDVYCYPSLDDSINYMPIVLENKKVVPQEFLFDVIEIPKSKIISIKGVSVWEHYINENSKDSTIRLFIFSKAEVEKLGWNYIIRKEKYLKKYRLKVNDLNKMNWLVRYR
jgi:hypothetical protein